MFIFETEVQYSVSTSMARTPFELMSVSHSARSGAIIVFFFSIFFNMKECCVFSLESPHRGVSNEYTQYTLLI